MTVKRTDQAVRLIASNRDPRNGMPPSGGYIYRGWYIDIMPWAITDDDSTDYDTGIERQHVPLRESTSRCVRCDHDYRSKHHKTHCR